MKKLFWTAAAAVMMTTAGISNVQAQSYEQGNILVSAGYGFGNLGKAIFKTLKNEPGYSFSSIGPVFVKGEYAASDNVGLGLNIAYLGMNVGLDYTNIDQNGELQTYHADLKSTGYSILGRVNFHFANGDKIDPYVGVGAGFRSGSLNSTDNDPNDDYNFSYKTLIPIGFETTLGVRYYVIDMLGIYAEIGLAKAPIQLGLTYKLGQ